MCWLRRSLKKEWAGGGGGGEGDNHRLLNYDQILNCKYFNNFIAYDMQDYDEKILQVQNKFLTSIAKQ